MAVITGKAPGDGIAHGELLVSFAEALLGDDEPELARLRASVVGDLGAKAFVDAAAVAALFNAIDRVASSTGIPVEEEKLAASADYRDLLRSVKYKEAQ